VRALKFNAVSEWARQPPRRTLAACAAALRAPDMQTRLQSMAVTPEPQPLEAWPAYFRAESDKWREFVRARNIRVQ
jgi:hypothetical protein